MKSLVTQRNSNPDTSHSWCRTQALTHPSTNIAHCNLTSVSRQILIILRHNSWKSGNKKKWSVEAWTLSRLVLKTLSLPFTYHYRSAEDIVLAAEWDHLVDSICLNISRGILLDIPQIPHVSVEFRAQIYNWKYTQALTDKVGWYKNWSIYPVFQLVLYSQFGMS